MEFIIDLKAQEMIEAIIQKNSFLLMFFVVMMLASIVYYKFKTGK